MHSDSPEASDAELVARTLRGDTAAFGKLYDRYLDPLYRYISFRVPTQYLAEDLTETAFLKTWEALANRGKKVHNFRAWLFRTAHNLVIDHYRTRKQEFPLEQMRDVREGQPSPEAQALAAEESLRLSQALHELEPNLQQVISCRFVSGLSHAETAEIMEISEGNVRVLQHRALKKLRLTLGEDLYR